MSDIDLIRNGTASAEQTASFGLHVSECSDCAARAADGLSLVQVAAAFEAALDPPDFGEHPSEDDLAALAEGLLIGPRREEIDAHIRGCSDCAGDVDDLRNFIRDAKPRARVWPAWLAAAAAVVIVAVIVSRWSDLRTQSSPNAIAPRAQITGLARDTGVKRDASRHEWDTLVADARRTGKLPLPDDIRELSNSDTYRGDSAVQTSVSLSPSGTAIDEQRPEFRWSAVPGARYTVVVTSDGSEISHSSTLSEARWTCDVILKRGGIYRWQVTAKRGGEIITLPAPPAPLAIFRVLSVDEHTQIEAVRREAKEDHLTLGVVYAHFGEIASARRELTAYAGSSQDPLAQRLLAQLPTP